MKMLSKVAVVFLFTSVIVGCASTSDVTKLQSQIDNLKVSVEHASHDAQSAQALANEATTRATAAEEAANRAAKFAEETNSKLDVVFKSRMTK
jgi:murein lipoprotein